MHQAFDQAAEAESTSSRVYFQSLRCFAVSGGLSGSEGFGGSWGCRFEAAYREPALLMHQAFDAVAEAESTSNRRRVEWVRDIEAGDAFDVAVHPRATHSCDGMSVIDFVIWPGT